MFHYETEGELAFLFCAALHGSCLKIKAYSKLCRSYLCNMATRKKVCQAYKMAYQEWFRRALHAIAMDWK